MSTHLLQQLRGIHKAKRVFAQKRSVGAGKVEREEGKKQKAWGNDQKVVPAQHKRQPNKVKEEKVSSNQQGTYSSFLHLWIRPTQQGKVHQNYEKFGKDEEFRQLRKIEVKRWQTRKAFQRTSEVDHKTKANLWEKAARGTSSIQAWHWESNKAR